ncbi:MAG TPA: hypothetical protein VNY79_04800 [Xanthobacteraceae bacterium]|jgi:hypothetical protein|nr:hypothetical protein [Xanthobacteraceae bacterium]
MSRFPTSGSFLMTPSSEAIPDCFFSISEAVSVLARGMWGGLQRPDPVGQFKKQFGNVSVGFGPWKEEAARRFRTAAIEGNVQVYVYCEKSGSASHVETKPVSLSIEVLARLIAPRGGLPDHAVRPSLKIAGGDTKLLALLARGILLVSKKDFDNWYRSQRSKRRWASQRLTKRRRGGRPSVQTEALRSAIFSILLGNKLSIAELRRRLVGAGQIGVPSSDTLERLVDQLHRETGEKNLRRIKRLRRKRV